MTGEEGSPGSFEVVWEAQDWRRARTVERVAA